MHDEYFEGTLQLRNPRKEILDFIEKEIALKKDVSISKIKTMKQGMDFNITSKKYIQKIGRDLQNRFGGTLKISPRLHTRNRLTSKDVYRVNVFFKATDIAKSSVIETNNKIIKVTSISKKIVGINLETNKKTTVDYSEEIKIIPKKETVVSKIKPSLEIIHPDSFQSVEVKNNKKVSAGEKVKIAETSKGIFIL